MTGNWQSVIKNSGGNTDDAGVIRFGPADSEIKSAAGEIIVTDLSHLCLVRVSGDDAGSFLQSQLSNDINQVVPDHSQISAYCTPKGRMLAIFRIFHNDGGYLLQFPVSLRESVINRLQMYVIRAKVSFAEETDRVAIGLSGPGADALLGNQLLPRPTEVDGCALQEGTLIVRLPGPHPRYQLIGDTTKMGQTWETLSKQATPTGEAAWSWLDIMAGLPTVTPATSEAFVPQMANLELLSAINFKKGCYPGQEIVARMQYLGKLKQRMVRLSVVSDHLPEPGEAIHAPNFPNQSAGTVVSAQPAPGGQGYDLLAVVQISSVENGELHLGDPEGPELTIESLPYSLEQEGA